MARNCKRGRQCESHVTDHGIERRSIAPYPGDEITVNTQTAIKSL